ncbi:MAG: ligase-associated DNA damage response exonuclease, partial [Bacteroidetes bacterium]|nr:ligase-associated DNA damage response exonuclease [Bacteroidota bacterium]
MNNLPLLSFNKAGIYCEKGDFYIDPWKKVNRAVITHAHSDHAREGSKYYMAHKDTVPVLKQRLGPVVTESTEYGKKHSINGVKVSFHPAGHIIGSSQIRIEYKGEVWVVSGDYKLENDNVSQPFEPVKCDVFISETTFGLPIYKWKPQKEVFEEINAWWKKNAEEHKASVLYGYSLGKAQRIIQNIDFQIGPVYTHGAVENINQIFRDGGFPIKPTQSLVSVENKNDFNKSLVIAPPSAEGGKWLKRLGSYSTAMASGWMAVRGMRRRRPVDRGFV